MRLGLPLGSLTRLSATQPLLPSGRVPARWSNCTVVLRPTLKLSQLRIAFSAVCSMRTCVRPSARLCCGALALSQPALRLWLSTLRPPSTRPSGTESSFCAACRAAACAACCAAIDCAARFRLLSERCHCALLRCCSACGFVRLEAGCPFGR